MIKNYSVEAQRLLSTGKQHFPYEYLDCEGKLEDQHLPSIDDFYSSLKDKSVTLEQYEAAQKVWEAAECKTLKDYMVAYLKVDVGILSDFFQEWRFTLMGKYSLDCIKYVSLPGYSYDAFLKMTQTELDLIRDEELCKLIQTNVRGGLTTVCKPVFTARNKHIDPSFDGCNSSYISYLDINSLYGHVMTQKLPQGNIRKMSVSEVDDFMSVGIENHSIEGDDGYWILCDIAPIHPDVARRTDELPLILKHKIITEEDLSPYNLDYLNSENMKVPKQSRKLVATHEGNKNVLHTLKLLQLLIELGAVVEQVHTVYKYSQNNYLKTPRIVR